MNLPMTIAQRIAELARSHHGETAALDAAKAFARSTEDNTARDDMIAFQFVDHSEAVFIGGKLFTIKLTFDFPGESRRPEGIEPPWLSEPTPAEDAFIGNIRVAN